MSLPSVFVIGDSIVLHYAPYLKRLLDGVCAVDGKPGANYALDNPDQPFAGNCGDSAMALAYLKELAGEPDFRPDLLLVNCGLHDIKTDPASGEKQVPLAEYRANLRSIVTLVRCRSLRMIWVSTTPVDDERHNSLQQSFRRYSRDQQAYNAAADEIMSENGVPIIDLDAFTRRLDGELYCDHVHFTEPVRQAQAAYIAGYLAARLA